MARTTAKVAAEAASTRLFRMARQTTGTLKKSVWKFWRPRLLHPNGIP